MLNYNVEDLEMNSGVSFNPSILFKYSGKGTCKSMIFRGNTDSKYYEEAEKWVSYGHWMLQANSHYSKLERLN